MSPEERFVAELKATADACADDYFRQVEGWPDDTPSGLWEEAWTALVDGVTEGTAKLCRNLGMDPSTSQIVIDSALTFVLYRVDQVNAALSEREGRMAN